MLHLFSSARKEGRGNRGSELSHISYCFLTIEMFKLILSVALISVTIQQKYYSASGLLQVDLSDVFCNLFS